MKPLQINVGLARQAILARCALASVVPEFGEVWMLDVRSHTAVGPFEYAAAARLARELNLRVMPNSTPDTCPFRVVEISGVETK